LFRLQDDGSFVAIGAKRKRDKDDGGEGPSNKTQVPIAVPDLYPERPERTFENVATQHLYDNGYAIIDLGFNNGDYDGLKDIRKGFLDELICFMPFEYDQDVSNIENGRQFQAGGFAAIGSPDSFHNITVRCLRESVHKDAMVPLMRELLQRQDEPDLNIECLVDRFLVRVPGQKPGAETWHRDESFEWCTPEDIIMGGWVNLNSTQDQYVSLIPGTHRAKAGEDPEEGSGGFTTFPKEYVPALNQKKQRLTIPPGHLFVFYQDTAHEVVSNVQKGFSQFRLFTGVRLTPATTSLVPDLDRRFDEKAAIPMKSGQAAPMFAQMHTNQLSGVFKVHDFTIGNLIPELREPYRGKYVRIDETFDSWVRAARTRLNWVTQEMYDTLSPQARRKVRVVDGLKRKVTIVTESDIRAWAREVAPTLLKPKTIRRKTGADTRESITLTELGLADRFPDYDSFEREIYRPQPFSFYDIQMQLCPR